MPIAALYDIHGNLPALEAVLDEARQAGADALVIGGDVVPGPMQGDCLAILRSLDLPVQYIRGNGEVAVVGLRNGVDPARFPAQAREVLGWSAQQLTREDERSVMTWPLTLPMKIRGVGRVLFCHGTPRDENEIFTRNTAEERLSAIFEGVDADVVVCGHTHMQFDRMIGTVGTVETVRVVNAGSVGMPFGEPGAYWLLLGPDIQLRRTEYDLAGAAERIGETAYPQAKAFAEQYVLHPPSESAMLEIYARAEVR
jgi:predicted phosphodiesterase